uniref:Uncharacterized protein n=1 Tax=Rhizophagus irregularis (strain DAOM 181602 / DAOM 197198 / MUCL 43194) TaxID=747089 RepID=U9SM46_RHIID
MALLENYASNLSKGASNNASNLPRAHHWMYGMDLSRRSTRTYLESSQSRKRVIQINTRTFWMYLQAEEPSIEWEFSIPNWLDKIAQEHQLLTSTMFSNNDTKIRYELSLK